ncbi:MAG TPA: hypothetical protein VNQ81_11885 [Povalibacter sp.]|nr:hypothetical protein [Povalibacter sp.]
MGVRAGNYLLRACLSPKTGRGAAGVSDFKLVQEITMRALIVLFAAALAVGLGGCKKNDAVDSTTTPPMEQPSQMPPPPEATPEPPIDQPSTEVPPAEEIPPANPDSGETIPPSTGSPPPNQ